VQGQVLTRPVDKVAVKGKINATMIHEVLGLRENATPELLRVIELSELGFGHYLAQKFEQAIGCYQQILEIKKDDHISLFYIERCRSFLVFPPSSDWDGVNISNSK
jgi:adenylate cyclase